MSGDCEKLNEAQLLGWTILQFTALHFREADRRKHKLTAPLAAIEAAAGNPSPKKIASRNK